MSLNQVQLFWFLIKIIFVEIIYKLNFFNYFFFANFLQLILLVNVLLQDILIIPCYKLTLHFLILNLSEIYSVTPRYLFFKNVFFDIGPFINLFEILFLIILKAI